MSTITFQRERQAMTAHHKASFFRKHSGGSIECRLCSHYCKIPVGETGACKMRINIDGMLYSLTYNAVTSYAIDPVEKKPFYHFKPGSRVLSFGAPGCNFSCLNCQNSALSQSNGADLVKTLDNTGLSPQGIAVAAARNHCDGIAYTYSEPTIFWELAIDTINECKHNILTKNMFHIFISNGYFSHELLDYIINNNILAAINIDLKFIRDDKYKSICGSSVQPVLDNITKLAKHSNIIFEVINLVIPDENDSDKDFEELCSFLSSVSVDIPLHFSKFIPQYRMMNKKPTDESRLLRAKEIAKNHGLRYVYLGNVNLPDCATTYCYNCDSLLIERNGYKTINNDRLLRYNGKYICSKCKAEINIIM